MATKILKYTTACSVCSVPMDAGQEFAWHNSGGRFNPRHVDCTRSPKATPPAIPAIPAIPDTVASDLILQIQHALNEHTETINTHTASLNAHAGQITATEASLDKFQADLTVHDKELARLGDAVENFRPRIIQVWHDAKLVKQVDPGSVHPQFDELLKWLGLGENVYLWSGMPGTGKSHAARQAARVLGLDFGYISLQPTTPESRLLGYMDATGNYRGTSFRRLYQNGGVFLIDELDNASDSMLTALNGALANDLCSFPDGEVPRHEEFLVVSTGNTEARGGKLGFSGRRAQDVAAMDRYVYIPWPLDTILERTIALSINPSAHAWIDTVQKLRSYVEMSQIQLVVSCRATYRGARWLLHDSETNFSFLADRLIYRGISRDIQSRLAEFLKGGN